MNFIKYSEQCILPLIYFNDYVFLQITEVKDIYHPLLKLVKEGRIQGKAAEYVETKFKLLLKYVLVVL